jgi:hypothetical protein
MGVATPKTGQIAFSDLSDGILQQGTTSQLNMNTAGVRMGFGSTSQLSISELRGCVGLSTSFTLQPATKFVPQHYAAFPNLTYNSAGDFIYSVGENPFNPAPPGGTDGTDYITLYASGFNPPGPGWQGGSVNRAASEGSTKTITGADISYFYMQPQVVDGTTSRAFGFRFG